jgi:cell division protein FtsB
VTRARWLALGVLVLLAIFAWQGGVYSVADYRVVVAEEAELTDRVGRLQHEVDSMRALLDSLQDNPQVVERLARERFGMIRPGEIAIQLTRQAADTGVGEP